MMVTRVLAPNPGIFTGPGTNTWVVEHDGDSVVIDPGPEIASHREAILEAASAATVRAVLVTHTHPDHAPLANPLADALSVPALARHPGPAFKPDRIIEDGEVLSLGAVRVDVVATPGHTADSTCYRIGDLLFSGDHVMGGSTVIVEDMSAYMTSLELLLGSGIATIHPGHGPDIEEPDALISEYLEHRRARERQILDVVRSGARSVGAVVESVYSDVSPELHPAAAVSVSAHLEKLASDGLVHFESGSQAWDAEVSPR